MSCSSLLLGPGLLGEEWDLAEEFGLGLLIPHPVLLFCESGESLDSPAQFSLYGC